MKSFWFYMLDEFVEYFPFLVGMSAAVILVSLGFSISWGWVLTTAVAFALWSVLQWLIYKGTLRRAKKKDAVAQK
jgi:hypothetical protein